MSLSKLKYLIIFSFINEFIKRNITCNSSEELLRPSSEELLRPSSEELLKPSSEELLKPSSEELLRPSVS